MIARIAIGAAALALAVPTWADSGQPYHMDRAPAGELQPYLQCVPFAREISGIRIYGDAHSWWDQAEGRYARGQTPREGAVLVLPPHRSMTLGHVAVVSQVVDRRTVLLTHANWSPINGQRGQIERDVRAVDVSAANDWSEVRIWWAPSNALGTTAWPAHGFIYPDAMKEGVPARLARVESRTYAAAAPAAARQPVAPARSQAVASAPSRQFLSAFSDLTAPGPAPVSRAAQNQRAGATAARRNAPAAPARASRAEPVDLLGAIYGGRAGR